MVPYSKLEASIATLVKQAAFIRSSVLANVEGFSHEQSLIAPERGGNCANWILGHLVYTSELTLASLEQESSVEADGLERYRRGSPALTSGDQGWEFAALVAAWKTTATNLEEGLANLGSERLTDEGDYFGRGSPIPLSDYLGIVLFHQAYHSGQLGILRRVVGKEGAIS